MSSILTAFVCVCDILVMGESLDPLLIAPLGSLLSLLMNKFSSGRNIKQNSQWKYIHLLSFYLTTSFLELKGILVYFGLPWWLNW